MNLSFIIFSIAFLLGCTYAFTRHPIYGLVTYVGVFYLNPQIKWWGQVLPSMRWSLLAAAVTLMAIFMHKGEAKKATLMSHKVVVGLLIFLLWIIIQYPWALDKEMQLDLISMYFKFMIAIFLIYRSVDTEEHLRAFLWAHVVGSAYLGWIAYTSYTGGRFEGFDAPGIGEANAGALQLVTATLIGGALFLAGNTRAKAVLLICLPVIVNAIVTTVSRSGFLALGTGGIVFNFFTPRRYRKWVRILSVVAILLFVAVTNPTYWMRIGSISEAGQDIQGVDTGGGRLEIIEAQLRMFASNPLGCGHRCTAVLSPDYLDQRFLAADATGSKVRASHNTFMSLLVEQGIVGAVFYFLFLMWLLINLVKIWRRLKNETGFLPTLFPAVAASAIAIVIGDLFVDYMKFEMRIWVIVMIMLMSTLSSKESEQKIEKKTLVRRKVGLVTAT